MLKVRLKNARLMLFFIGLISLSITHIAKAGYDDTYVLAVKQKFAIPENVENGDYVGTWLKTLTWKTKTQVTFSIDKNFKDAFSIHSTTGLLTISNAAGIKGKIVRQDTIINVLIRTSDAEGTEIDTAQIFIKENAFCKFIDYSYRSTETGKREQPLNDLDDIAIKPGYGYFIKRGTLMVNEYTPISNHLATSSNPTIFGAYGKGKKPRFTSGTNICFYLGDTSGGSGDPDATRCQYIYFFDLSIRDYNSAAFYTRRKSNNLGWYNMDIANCDKNDIESTLVINTSSYSDRTATYNFEVLNCRFDTTSINCSSGCEKSFIKNGVGPTRVTNTYFGYINGMALQLRLSAGNGSIVRHCVFQPGSYVTTAQNAAGVQIRQDNVLIEDCIFNNLGNGVFITNPGTIGPESQPDKVRVRNCRFEGQGLNAIHVSPVTSSDLPGTGHIFEDNYMTNVANGIDLRDCTNAIIRRNIMANGKGSGIQTGGSEPSNGTLIDHNIIYGFGGNEINYTRGSSVNIHNNTVIGTIITTGATSVRAFNNYASAFDNSASKSNNLDLDTLDVNEHFVNFTQYDLRLKATAASAIDHGIATNCLSDFCGTAVKNLPDIGAYEVLSGTIPETPIDPPGVPPSTPPVGDPVIPAGVGVYIDPSNSADPIQDGTISHPFDSWTDVKWVSGKIYVQKRGTTANVEKIVIGADNVTLGAYGTGSLPILKSTTTSYVISGVDRKNIKISSLNLQGTSAASSIYFLGTLTNEITIEHCVISNTNNGIRIPQGQHIIIRYNTISSKSEGIQSSGTVNEIYYNVLKNNAVAINLPAQPSKANIHNNVFVANGEAIAVMYAELKIFNNIFYLTQTGQKAIKYVANQITSDNNIFYPEYTGFIQIGGKSYNTLQQLQQILKLDLKSYNANPMFTDVNSGNYILKSNSPAIDNGADVSLALDFNGVKVPTGNGPDIGILEFTGKKTNAAEVVETAQINVYPNPSTGIVNINFEHAITESAEESSEGINRSNLKVVDLSGRIIQQKEISSAGSFIETFDLSKISNGVYLVVFEKKGIVITKKLILYR